MGALVRLSRAIDGVPASSGGGSPGSSSSPSSSAPATPSSASSGTRARTPGSSCSGCCSGRCSCSRHPGRWRATSTSASTWCFPLPAVAEDAVELVGHLVFLIPCGGAGRHLLAVLPGLRAAAVARRCKASIWAAARLARRLLALGEQSANAGGLPLWPAKLLIPLGFALLLQAVSEICKRLAILGGALEEPPSAGTRRRRCPMPLDLDRRPAAAAAADLAREERRLSGPMLAGDHGSADRTEPCADHVRGARGAAPARLSRRLHARRRGARVLRHRRGARALFAGTINLSWPLLSRCPTACSASWPTRRCSRSRSSPSWG